eukprot:131844_1
MQLCIVGALPDAAQTHCKGEPTHSITEKSKSWSNSSHASQRNEFQHTPTRDNTHSMWCDNAPKHIKTQHQSTRANMKHNQRDETDSIGTDHIAHTTSASGAYSTQHLPSLPLKSVVITFVLMMTVIYGCIRLTLYTTASYDVIEPSHINRNVKRWTPVQSLRYDSTHLSPTHIAYSHHPSSAQSTRASIKALYNRVQQPQKSNHLQTLCSVAAALFGAFVSQSRAFKLSSFVSHFKMLILLFALSCLLFASHAAITCNSVTIIDIWPLTYPIDACIARDTNNHAHINSRKFVCDSNGVAMMQYFAGTLDCSGTPSIKDLCYDSGMDHCVSTYICNSSPCTYYTYLEHWDGVTQCTGDVPAANAWVNHTIEPLVFDTHCPDGVQLSCVVDAILFDIYDSTDCSSAGYQLPVFETGCDASTGTAEIVQCNLVLQPTTTTTPTIPLPTQFPMQLPTQSPTTATQQPTQFPTSIYCATHDLRNVTIDCIACIGGATQSCRSESIYAGAGTLVINCTEENACEDASIYGGAGELFVNCIADKACDHVSIYGGTGELFINCIGYGGCSFAEIHANGPISIDAQAPYSLAFAHIWCNTTTYCNITAQEQLAVYQSFIYANRVSGTKLFINATGRDALLFASIYCPLDYIRGNRYSNDGLCNIYLQGGDVMSDTHIYAMESFHNVKIECDTREDRSTVHRDFVLYCTQQFDENCTLQCPQNDVG